MQTCIQMLVCYICFTMFLRRLVAMVASCLKALAEIGTYQQLSFLLEPFLKAPGDDHRWPAYSFDEHRSKEHDKGKGFSRTKQSRDAQKSTRGGECPLENHSLSAFPAKRPDLPFWAIEHRLYSVDSQLCRLQRCTSPGLPGEWPAVGRGGGKI